MIRNVNITLVAALPTIIRIIMFEEHLLALATFPVRLRDLGYITVSPFISSHHAVRGLVNDILNNYFPCSGRKFVIFKDTGRLTASFHLVIKGM